MNVATAMTANAAAASSFATRRAAALAAFVLGMLATGAAAAADGAIYYQCPGNVFTNTITPKEAEARGCTSKEATQPTTIPAPKTHAPVSGANAASKVASDEQKARDADARKILQDELTKAQAQLDALNKTYNNGSPERLGDEKNYQKYLDRTADLKAQITRTEADIAALQREIAKTQQ